MESIKTLTHTPPSIKYHQNVINVMSIFMFYKYTNFPLPLEIVIFFFNIVSLSDVSI